MSPLGTGVEPQLRPLPGIRGVLFDVYGTLFISGSGEVGTADGEGRAAAFAEALAEGGLALAATAQHADRLAAASQCLFATIEAEHAARRAEGRDNPEVDIVSIWRTTLSQLAAGRSLTGDLARVDVHRLAAAYEVRANPTWPMPGCLAVLQALSQRGVSMGMVSNAQFFTPELFPGLLGRTAEQLGLDPQLTFFSYQHGCAKPSLHLFRLAADELLRRGVHGDNVLYIGNDLLNDVMPAQRVGFRTALFAGDARSLRMRSGDPRVAGVIPDLVVTHLSQLINCLDDAATLCES